MNKRLLILVALMTVALLALSACGAPAAPAPAPAAEAPAAEAPAAEAPAAEAPAPAADIVDTAVAAGSFNTLVTAVQAAGLVDALKGEGPFTVFAPSDDAFAKIDAATIEALLADPTGDLTQILLYHVVPGKVMSSDLSEGLTAETLQGGSLTFTLADGAKVNGINIVAADIETSNGVIHVVDSVILPPAAEEAAAEEPVLGLRPEGGILIWADDQRAPFLQELATAFTDEFGIPAVVEQPANPREAYVIAAPAGEGPDLIIGAHDWLGQFVANGLVAPVDLAGLDADFNPVAVDAFTYDGELYGMPVATENIAFFRNTDLVPDAPATWDDLLAICEELGDAVEQCFPQREADPYHFYPIQTSFGGDVFGRTENGSFDPANVQIDSEGSLASAQFLADIGAAGLYQPGADYDIYHTLFEQGNAAFIITGPWALERIDASGVPYAISAFPAGTQPGAPFLGAQGFMVNPFGEGAIEAQLFLTEFIATPEVMQEFAERSSRPSAFMPVLNEQMMDNPALEGFAAAGVDAVPMPAIPEMASVWTAWSDAQTLIIQGAEDPIVAFTNAAEQIRTLIAGE